MRLSRDSAVLIAFASLYKLTELFVGSFLIAYIMRLASNTIVAVSIFRLMEYLTLMFGCFFIAHLCKVYNRVIVFGIHLIAYLVLMGALVLLGDNVLDQLFLVGIMYGVAQAFYNFPYNVMVAEKIAPDKMAHFIGLKTAVRNTVRVVAPAVLGIFITLGSFIDMARVMLVIICMSFGLLFLLGHSRDYDTRRIDYRGFIHRVMRFPVINRMFFAEWLRGVADLLDTTITMYTVYIFYTDLKLGFLTTIFSICTILTSSIYSHYAKRRHFAFFARLCSFGLLAGICVFAAVPTKITFLLYNLAFATTAHIISSICDAVMFNLGQSHIVTHNYKTEYLALREMALCTGRWFVLIMLLYIGMFGSVNIMRWSLLIMGGAMVFAVQISVAISAKLKNR